MHVGSNDTGSFLALLAGSIPRSFVVLPRRFVDNGIFCRALWAGEPDNIPAAGSGNLGF